MKTALYRHYDRTGQLLYVGITNHALRRLDQHSVRAAWFQQIARITIEWHSTREAAAQAERDAIRRERPAHNIRLVAPRPQLHHVAWGVFHPVSRRFDGWYFDEDEAREILEFFRSEFPDDSFLFVGRTQDQRPATGLKPLRPHDCKAWAVGRLWVAERAAVLHSPLPAAAQQGDTP